MTAALARAVDDLALEATSGVSVRAVQAVLRSMARLASDAGEFQWGIKRAKLAARTDYSPSVVARAQRVLVDRGFIERVKTGGGRSSTHWRIAVDKLHTQAAPRHSTPGGTTRQPRRRDTGQGRRPGQYVGSNTRSPATNQPRPARVVLAQPTCQHGDRSDPLPNGQPRCPLCRAATRPQTRQQTKPHHWEPEGRQDALRRAEDRERVRDVGPRHQVDQQRTPYARGVSHAEQQAVDVGSRHNLE